MDPYNGYYNYGGNNYNPYFMGNSNNWNGEQQYPNCTNIQYAAQDYVGIDEYEYSQEVSNSRPYPRPPPPPPPSAPPPPIAPPPPVDEHIEENGAYSPSRANAEDDMIDEEMEDANDPGEVEMRLRREREASNALALKEMLEFQAREREREEKEREEHIRRVEAENKKKRKVNNRFSASKLKRVELTAFGGDDEEQVSRPALPLSDEKPTITDAESALNEETIQVIIKTASWVANNEDKAPVLIENSKSNPKLHFLFEKNNTLAGRRYLEELQKFRTQKKVQDVCTGTANDVGISYNIPVTTSVMPTPPPPQISNIVFDSQAMEHLAALSASLQKANNFSNGIVPTVTSSPLVNIPPLSSSLPVPVPLSLPLPLSITTPNNLNQSIATSNMVENDHSKPKKERKNRWGPPNNTSPVTIPAGSTLHSSSTSNISSEQSIPLPNVPAFNIPSMDPKMAAQIKEQKELQLLERRIREAATMAMQSKLSQEEAAKALYEERLQHYQELAALDDDNEQKDTIEDALLTGGALEGGSWEHRKRAKEMIATATKNLELTMLASGKHHLADFLPKAELDKFLRKAEAVTTGSSSLPIENDYEENKIQENNIGYQMLQKAGWTTGEGLGVDATGMSAPLNMNDQRAEGTGVGVHATHEVEADDDAFGSYRKRMMLAYRFRPNPLNNPRRDYY